MPEGINLQGIVYRKPDFFRLQRLTDVPMDASLVHRIHHRVKIGECRHQETPYFRVFPGHDLQQFRARHVRHALVRDKHLDLVFLQDIQCYRRGSGDEYVIILVKCRLEQDKVRFQVINVQDVGLLFW